MRKLFSLAFAAALFLSAASPVAAAITDTTGLNTTVGSAGLTVDEATTGDLPYFIGYYVIQPILGIVGLIFFLMMLYAGVLWLTAGGNTDSVKKAKQIFGNSIIGVVIISAAYVLTTAVLNAITTGSV